MHANQTTSNAVKRYERLLVANDSELQVVLDALDISSASLSLPAAQSQLQPPDLFAPFSYSSKITPANLSYPPTHQTQSSTKQLKPLSKNVLRALFASAQSPTTSQASPNQNSTIPISQPVQPRPKPAPPPADIQAPPPSQPRPAQQPADSSDDIRKAFPSRAARAKNRPPFPRAEPSSYFDDDTIPPVDTPFRTARSRLRPTRTRPRTGVSDDDDGGLAPGPGAAAMTRAVLGPAKRPRFSAPRPRAEPVRQPAHGAGKDDTTRDDLPQIPNVEPKLVEMIMNEMLDKSPGVDWDDIAGLHFAKRCVMEAIVWPMKRPDIFTGLRGPPKGLLLFGPPGTGKTLIGRAIASKSGAKFFNISASSLMSKWVGEGEKMVRALFAVARVFQPSVIFVDEIDSLLTQRTDGEQESTRRIKTEFLVQMDGAGTSREDRVLLVGATNRPQELDEAARRRLVKRLYIPLPDHEARCSLVSKLLQKQTNSLSKQDVEHVANISQGYSGSDMYALCAEAALGPVRELGESIGNVDVDSVRAVGKKDFEIASRMVRASVSNADLDGYIEWNTTFGSFPSVDPSDSNKAREDDVDSGVAK